MGTTYHIKYVVDDLTEVDSSVLKKWVDNFFNDFDKRFSTYRNDSELMQFNLSKDLEFKEISAELFELFEISYNLFKKTDGAFDVGIGPLIEVWGFGKKKDVKIPSDQEINERLKYSSISFVQLNVTTRQLQKNHKDIFINFSAIAPGFAADKIGEYLKLSKIKNFMVEVGGEIITFGKKSKNQNWTLGIEMPQKNNKNKILKLESHNYSLATSGSYNNYYVKNSKKYSHTIDPKTGRPVNHSLLSVSVVSKESCAATDALATALMVKGEIKGFEFSNQNKIAAIFTFVDEKGAVKSIKSNEFLNLVRGTSGIY